MQSPSENASLMLNRSPATMPQAGRRPNISPVAHQLSMNNINEHDNNSSSSGGGSPPQAAAATTSPVQNHHTEVAPPPQQQQQVHQMNQNNQNLQQYHLTMPSTPVLSPQHGQEETQYYQQSSSQYPRGIGNPAGNSGARPPPAPPSRGLSTNSGVEYPPHTQQSHHHHHNHPNNNNPHHNPQTWDIPWYYRFITGTPAVILGAALGIGIGIVLNKSEVSSEVASWVALPGNLFIRALKALVVPMVFASLSVGMADILSVGKASVIGWRTACYYILTSVISSTISVLLSLVVRRFYTLEADATNEDTTPVIGLQCANGLFMERDSDTGVLSCTGTSATDSDSTQFTVSDINSVFTIETSDIAELTFSEQLMGLFDNMVTENITQSFADGQLLSVVMFAIPFGIAVSKSHPNRYTPNTLLEFMRQVNNTFLLMIRWIINVTPIAVISLIAGSLAEQSDNLERLRDVGFLILTIATGAISHVYIIMPTLFYLFTFSNPYTYLKQMIPAQIFAFGCASSMATLPVTMRCVDATKQVSRSLSRFIVSIGATINMDGAALYYPAAIIFLADTGGIGDQLGTVELVLLVFTSTIASIGGAPVPSAALVMLLTVWNAVMSGNDVPATFSYLVATDWLIDRFRTTVNVTGDTLITRIIADQVDETYLDEHDRNMPL